MTKALLCASVFAMTISAGFPLTAEADDILTYSTEDDGKTLIISGSGDLTSQSTTIATEIKTHISDATKVVFKNTGTDECKINSDIVKAILATDGYSPNSTMTTLDLGETTVDDLSVYTFCEVGSSSWLLNNLALSTLTIPMTKKDADGGMTVPAYLLANSNGNGWGSGWTHSKADHINIIVPTGYTKVGENAFKGAANTKSITLPEGITEIGQDAFRNCSKLQGIDFPSTLVTIDEYAFKGCTDAAFDKIVFPTSLKTIKCAAFSNCKNIKYITLNEGLEYIGNMAFYTDASVTEQTVLKVPGSVQYIGPGAFIQRWYEDIYYLGEKAPAEPMGLSGDPEFTNLTEMTAVGNNLYMGNNGFDASSQTGVGTSGNISGEGEGNRQNYVNGSAYFCILHFRGDLTKDQEETFTDITRYYQGTFKNSSNGWSVNDTFDNVGKEENSFSYGGVTAMTAVNTGYIDTYRGKQYTWPSQSQWMRSYILNTWGYKWDGVTKYEPATTVALTQQQKDWIQNDPGIKGKTATAADAVLSTISDLSNLTDADYNLLAYLGTRRHVFIALDAESSVDYKVTDMQSQKWQTICLPCNVTKKQVDEVFGQNSQVCLFSKVERSKTESNKHLHLYFQNDTYRHRFVKQADGSWLKDDANDVVGDDSIVIRANEAYMIYATKNPEGGTYIIENYDIQPGSPLPTVIAADDEEQTKYSFIGNRMTKGNIPDETTGDYENITVPQYSYFYAKKSSDSYYKFWFYEGQTFAWQKGKCIVERYELRSAANDKQELFTSTTSANTAKQQSFFGEDAENDPTSIDEATIICGEPTADAPIYNLQGQYMGQSRHTLAKGLYIQNGQKFVVK